MNILTTICARAGSKRLPGKNWKELCGKPLFLWTVEQAIEWAQGDIAVNTDSEEIIDGLPIHERLHTIERLPELAQDNTGKLDVIRHTVKQMEYIKGQRYDIVVDLDVTNPMRTLFDIDNCIDLLHKGWDTVVSAVPARRDPAFNMVAAPHCRARLYDEWRRYAPGDVYDLNACIYIYRRDWLYLNQSSPVGIRTDIYVMPPETAFDIDTEVDFKIVEMFMRERINAQRELDKAGN